MRLEEEAQAQHQRSKQDKNLQKVISRDKKAREKDEKRVTRTEARRIARESLT